MIKPTVMMYCLEAYSAGLPHLDAEGRRHQEAMAQLAKAYQWMSANCGGQAGIDYISQWGSKFGGLPFHMYVYAKQLPDAPHVAAAADRELRHIAGVLRQAPPSNQRDQLALFAMMSYAEKLSPGAIYRTGTITIGGMTIDPASPPEGLALHRVVRADVRNRRRHVADRFARRYLARVEEGTGPHPPIRPAE